MSARGRGRRSAPDVGEIDLFEELERDAREARAELETADSLERLEEVEHRWLGRKGRLTAWLRRIGELPRETRGKFGREANRLKEELAQAAAGRRAWLRAQRLRATRDYDPTTPAPVPPGGHEHPVLALERRIEDVFLRMGFDVLEGPEVETEYYNFEALNIPEHHPARDAQDTFHVEPVGKTPLVLRTHTSPMQVRAMRLYGAPLRVVVPGRVYRNETCDATHEHTFHQVEGLYVDEGVSVAHLKGVMATFLSQVLEREVEVRLRPHYFPFVEPGFELDILCAFCQGDGCATCKGTGWIELLGCGLVHERVLEAGGVDPARYSGFAFGMGLERLAMMKHGIEDIRHFHGGDLRFLSQF